MKNNRPSTAAAAIAMVVLLMTFAIRGLTANNNDFHFALIGDRTGGAQPQIYGRVWQEVDLFHPDFVLNVGDTIEGGDDDTAEEEWKALRPIWDRYKHYPIYFTPGNHDVWSAKSKQLYERESKRGLYYSFDYQQMHFTVLDNSRAGQLSEEQLQFLESDLQKNAGKSPKLVVFHRPMWIESFARGGEFKLHEIAKRHAVDSVISGHGHVFVRMIRDGVTYMEVGSSGGTMAKPMIDGKGFTDGRFYHFVWAHVNGGKIQYTVKEIGMPMGQGRVFRAEDWDEKGPKFDSGDPALKEKPQT